MIEWLRSEPDDVRFEKKVRQHLETRLQVSDYLVDRAMDNLLKKLCSAGSRVKALPADVSLGFAAQLCLQWRNSDEQHERDASVALIEAIKFEIPQAVITKEATAKMAQIVADKLGVPIQETS